MNCFGHLLPFILALLLLPAVAGAAAFFSGNEVVISDPLDDDLFASGGRIVIDAPVRSVVVAGGDVTINAPVGGDVIAAGGSVRISADVDGKVIAAGGSVAVEANITTNALLSGGTILIGRNAAIGRDAYISGQTVRNEGTVGGVLNVDAVIFDNTGTAGEVIYVPQETDRIPTGLSAFGLLITLGYLIAGLLLLRLFPEPMSAIGEAILRSPGRAALFGLAVLVVTPLLILLLLVTVVGAPLAALLGILFVTALLLASIFVALPLGLLFTERFEMGFGAMGAFVLGFILIHVLFAIPFLGVVVRLLSFVLGYGGVLIGLRSLSDWRGA
jgi:hypothetical protein